MVRDPESSGTFIKLLRHAVRAVDSARAGVHGPDLRGQTQLGVLPTQAVQLMLSGLAAIGALTWLVLALPCVQDVLRHAQALRGQLSRLGFEVPANALYTY